MTQASKARKQFFFEKKNQKTFVPFGRAPSIRTLQHGATAQTKAFCFFFSKKKAFLPSLVCLLFLLATPAHAISDPREMLADPVQEARAEQVGSQLRCLVCQNESIEDSNADLAKDLRAIVRQRVAAGETDKQIMSWMVARYGNFLLWFTPGLALLAGVAAAMLGRRRTSAVPPPLTEAEQARLAELSRTA